MLEVDYQHRQRGHVALAGCWFGAGLCALAAAFSRGMPWVAYGTLPIGAFILFMGWLFSSLTVEVDQEELRHWFGPGFWRKNYLLSDIDSAEPVRNTWIYGWGIRLTPFGWLYNVSGLDAVQVTLRSGRRFRIGTDDAEGLTAAIQSRAS